MNSVHSMTDLTRRGKPWALARFNDGEMMAIQRSAKTVARGDQPCTDALAADLRWCLQQQACSLFMGLPCGTCWPKHRADADELVVSPYKTLAVVQTNRNLDQFKREMPLALAGRVVHWISGEDQVTDNLPFTVHYSLRLPLRDAYTSCRDEIMVSPFGPGDVVFLSCGPLATVMAVRLFLRSPDTTFIDIGSTWDPETRGVSHSCHNGTLKPCKECN